MRVLTHELNPIEAGYIMKMLVNVFFRQMQTEKRFDRVGWEVKARSTYSNISIR